uniref:RNA-dependent RNA polymerase n=2 Tax=Hirondellea gigas TaxID=1518452 RepID=A0A6A7G3N6_9CRUS
MEWKRFIRFVSEERNSTEMAIMENAFERLVSRATIVYNLFEEFMKLIDFLSDDQAFHNVRIIPDYCAITRKVYISPLKITPIPPLVEQSNRVLRRFPHLQSRFLRVTFCDEELYKMHYIEAGQSEDITTRILSILQYGLLIGSRRFSFLAWSTSQLREHSLWLFNESDDYSAQDIRDSLGTFSERIVAKYAARLGQPFSASYEGSSLNKGDVVIVDDIKRYQYTFSDGIGKCRPDLMKKICRQAGFSEVYSGLQIRIGGAKGMIVSWANTVHPMELRKSMIKFQSDDLKIDVLSRSKCLPGYLNRQIILLLSHLNIPDSVFEDIQSTQLTQLDQMIIDRQAALSFFRAHNDDYGLSSWMTQILNDGFALDEPFIRGILKVSAASEKRQMKDRAHLLVDRACLVKGALDETGILSYGEIFIQYQQPNGEYVVMKGRVAVAKNPCLHPGDIRILIAVDVECLHHLKNLAVFPSQGPRPHPNECSGSDLDGDQYFVTDHPDLVPDRAAYEPMDYTSPVPKTVFQVTMLEIHRFFVDYIKNDLLGVIANAHLAQADVSEDGPSSEACLMLANLHSIAVDFPKTGVPAKLDKGLIPVTYPDFLQKKTRPMHVSKKILGKLYRNVVSEDLSVMREYPKIPVDQSFEYRMNLDSTIVDEMKFAYRVRDSFNGNILEIMNQYGIKSESELISGNFLEVPKLRGKREFYVKSTVLRAVNRLRDNYRQKFFEPFEVDHFKMASIEDRKLMISKALAWYLVTYIPISTAFKRKKITLLSFAWVMSDILGVANTQV